MELQRRVRELQGRFQQLAQEGDDPIRGTVTLAAALGEIAAGLNHDTIQEPQRLSAIVQRLAELLDLLEPQSHSSDVASASDQQQDPPSGLDQFVDTFRNDAGKRIQGLSISLMGIFGEQCSEEALEQSADHLHAIRGSAAMLGFEDIAELAGEMENLLNSRAKVEVPDWEWPTKVVLRGYALLEMAIDADPPGLKPGEGEGIVDQLQSAIAELESANRGGVIPNDDSDSTATEGDETSTKSITIDATTGADLEQPILVVDDVDTIAASVGFILSELEVPVEAASDGKEAIQMLNQKPFSVVISDVDMPKMDGITLTEMIRADEELKHLPVILLTSLDHPDERQRGMEAGATDYIIKGSIGGGELVRRVRQLLEDAPVVQREQGARNRRILVAEDTETVAASIAFVLSEGPFEIILATDGKDAYRRLEKQDYDLLITDMQMPYMNGIELVGKVREHDKFADLPVVMLTSVEDEEKRQAAIDAGVDRYMIKGEIAGGRLLSAVEELLEN